jgi:hypothetical protein
MKRTVRFIPILLALVLATTACSLPFLAGSGGESTEESTAAPTEETMETATVAPTAAPGQDACLQGNWVMDHESVQELMAALIPMSNFHVQEGILTMQFSGVNYTYASDGFVLRIDMDGGNFMEASADLQAVGTFSTANDEILFNNTSSTSEITTWRIYMNGEYADFPGTAPTLIFGSPASGAYTCSADTLTVGTEGTANTSTPMVFHRQP